MSPTIPPRRTGLLTFLKRRTGKVGLTVLIGFALFSIILFIIEVGSAKVKRARFYKEKLAAALITKEAFDKIKIVRDSLLIPIDKVNDPNETGLIGHQYSQITFGLADLSEKLTATNPNFTAILIELLKSAGLKSEDKVGIAWTGSFPALNIGLLATCSVLNLKPIIITTLTSSSWGANDPKFNWLVIEEALAPIFPYRSVAASLGGEDDNGRGLSEVGRGLLDSAISLAARGPVPLQKISSESLEKNIIMREKIYSEMGPIKVFINVDKAIANYGLEPLNIGEGVVNLEALRAQIKSSPKSLLARIAKRPGVKIINITSPNRLARRYNLPVAPIPLPPLGKGRLFFEKRYPVGLAVLFTVLIILGLFFIIRYDLEYYLLPKKPKQ